MVGEKVTGVKNETCKNCKGKSILIGFTTWEGPQKEKAVKYYCPVCKGEGVVPHDRNHVVKREDNHEYHLV